MYIDETFLLQEQSIASPFQFERSSFLADVIDLEADVFDLKALAIGLLSCIKQGPSPD